MRSLLFLAGTALALLMGSHSLLAQPVITTLTPTANAVSSPRSQALSATFSQPLQAASTSALKVFSARRGGLRTGHSGTTAVAGSALTFTPGAFDWLPGETVQYTLTTAARNASGQALAAARVAQFTAAVGGAGRGSFIPPVVNPNPSVGGLPRSAVLGDLDGDGDLDLVTAHQSTSSVNILLNSGVNSGNFVGGPSNSMVPVGNNPVAVVLGDVDGDGDLDLLAANANFGFAGSVSLRLNDGTGRFTAPATNPNIAVSNEPNHLTLGDIDGDGDLDLITANSNFGNNVSVRLNSGLNSGNFVAPAVNPNPLAGQSPGFVALGDLDGDGDLDLVVSNSDDTRLSIMLNSGLHSGNFVLASSPTVGARPASVALGDLDGDGDLDIVVGKADGTNTVYILTNTGQNSGTFSYGPGLGAAFADTNPGSVALGDVDADGDLDIVTANGSASSVSVRLNIGLNSATFGGYDTTHNFPVDGNPSSVVLGDLDGDGDLDLVATGLLTYTGSVRLNNLGPPPVVPPTLVNFYPTSGPVGTVVTLYGTGFTGATAIAFNGTAATNFTVVSATMATVTVPVGATTGPISLTGPTGTATSANSFTVVVPPFAVSSLAPARGLRNAPPASNIAVSFSQSLSPAAATTGAIRAFSMQRGGKLSGVASSSGSTLTFNPTNDFKPGETIFTTVGTAVQSSAGTSLPYPHVHQFTAATAGPGRGYLRPLPDVAVGRSPTGVAMGDVDNDGDLDLLSCSYSANSVSVRLNGGDASGSNTGVFSGTQEVPVGYFPGSVVLGDVDNDGDLDLLSASTGVGYAYVHIRLNGGDASGSATGLFSGGTFVQVASSPTTMAVGDVDGDGDLDVVVASQVSAISVLRNQGNGTFVSGTGFNGQRATSGVSLGDVDGDGDLDAVFGDEDGTVIIRLNGGDGTGSNTGVFTAGRTLFTGYQPTSVALGDIDGDNDLDIVAGNSLGTAVIIRLNGGDASGSNTGVFSQGTDLTVNAVPRSVVLGDVDADGDLDLVLINPIYNGSVLVYRNGGDATGSNTGTFSGEYNYPGGLYPAQVVLGDVDGDGDLDVATANSSGSGSGSMSVYLNTDGGGVLGSSVAAVCAGINTGTLTLQYAAGTVVTYQADTGAGYQPLSGTSVTLTFTNLTTTTTFRAVVLNPGGQTVYSQPVTVTVRPLPVAGLVAAGPTTFCAGGSVQLQASSSIAGSTYQFRRDGAALGNPGTSSTLVASLGGSYTVLVNALGGCSSTSAPVTVVASPLPTRPTVTATTTGGVTTLTSSAPAGNQWYFNGSPITGATATTYVVPVPTVQTGSYTVVTTSAQGCASAASLAVVITSSRQSLPTDAVRVYPNPTPTGEVTIELTSQTRSLVVTVLNSLGQVVGRFVLPAGHLTHTLDLQALPSGLYVLRIATAEGVSNHVLVRQ